MRIWNQSFTSVIFWFPLLSTSWTFCKFPFVAKKVFEIIVTPFSWGCSPSTFKSTGDGISTISGTERIFPTFTLFFDAGSSRFWSNVFAWICGAMCFTKRMTTSDKCNGFFVVHRHASKGFADVACRGKRVGVTVRSFWIYVNKSHLNSS